MNRFKYKIIITQYESIHRVKISFIKLGLKKGFLKASYKILLVFVVFKNDFKNFRAQNFLRQFDKLLGKN